MKRTSCYRALALTTAVGMVHATAANAAGTVAGTNVQNTATVGFSVGGVAQTPVNSNTASFLVDRRVNLSVSEDGAVTTSVAPGSVNQVTKFILSNTTNDTLDFALAAAQDAGGTAAHGGTDNFNATNVRVFVDHPTLGTVGSYDANDTALFVDELAPDTTRAIFVVVDVPLAQVNGDVAGVTLTATAAAGGVASTQGANLTETVGGNTAGIDTLFDDAAGDTDALRDGRSSDDDDYTVSAATITLNKTSRIISDPVRGVTNPLLIPGALVEYCIEVANTGAAAATGIAFSDTLSGDLTWATGASQNFRVGGAVVAGSCDDTGSVEDDNAAGADESDPNGGAHAAGVVSASIPTVAAATSTTVKFRVTVD